MGAFINGQRIEKPFIKGKRANAFINGEKVWKEYALKSSGTQWINTGIAFREENNKLRFEIDWRQHVLATPRALQGAGTGPVTGTRFLLGTPGTISASSRWIVGVGANANVNTGITNDTQRHVHTMSLQKNPNTFSYSVDRQIYTNNSLTTPTTNNFTLFNTLTGNNVGAYNGARTVYSAKIYIDDIIVRDFVPVPAGSKQFSSTPAPSNCMWCKVTKQYFENAGTGSFNIEEV